MAQRLAVNRQARAKKRPSGLSGHGLVARDDFGVELSRQAGLYDDPVIYDLLHEPGTHSEARTLARVWKRVSAAAPRVALEPACGTGRYLERLARAGWIVRGFDLDANMVKFAMARLRELGANKSSAIRVWRDRFDTFGRRVRADSVGLAFCPINSIRHVASDAELVRHLRMIRRVLAPGGVYAVGISLSVYGAEAPTEDIWKSSRRGISVKQIVNYTPAAGRKTARERAERVDSVLEIRRGNKTEIRSASYSLLSFSREQWENAVARSGLVVIGIVNESAARFDPGAIGYAIWLLARPEHPLSVRGSGRSD
ncbi:MAG: class I SAM-dependent methyltransferase [Phycisphaeraceae bacterium]|nr:class I SAM-dependent methyltransferase [Phycisphaeraceae bacterium]